MADTITPAMRSSNMAAIKNKDTVPEIYLRKKLYGLGYRYRKNYSKIEGNPDIWLGRYNTAVFVHGCFWHRHSNCKYAYVPKSRQDFWLSKFEKNVERDNTVKRELISQNIKIATIWECTINRMKTDDRYEKEILDALSAFFVSDEQIIEF